MPFFSPTAQTRFVLYDTTETTSNSTAFVNSATTLTLPSGNYCYDGLYGLSTDSTTAGGSVELNLATGFEIAAWNLAYRGSNFFGTTFNYVGLRRDTLSEYTMSCNLDGGASSKAIYVNCRGILILTSSQTFGFKIAQRTTTDSANPAKLMKHSYILFNKF